MPDLQKILEKAKASSWSLRMLNLGLYRMIPFNRPHGIKILTLGDDFVTTILPYKKRNFNHIKGLHATALATLCEFTTGILLISRFDIRSYRIILKTLHLDYYYQGKMDATATFKITDSWLDQNVFKPLENQESIIVDCDIDIFDKENNHLTRGKVSWQLKPWNKVKTKV